MKYDGCEVRNMAFKERDADTLGADVEEIVAGFGQKYPLDFCQPFTEKLIVKPLSYLYF